MTATRRRIEAPASPGISLTPTRSTFAASRAALWALILRDLVVLGKHFGEFIVRTLIQPFLLAFVFLYVFPTIGQGIGGGGGAHSHASESAFATVLVAGVVGISIMFQGIQAVALPMSTEFGYTREIEDRVQAPCPIWLVAISKVLSGSVQGVLAALIVFPIAAVVHATGVSAHLHVHWLVIVTLIPLACLAMTSLGLVLGTTFEPRNIGLMWGFVVLPLTFLGGTYYQWTKLAPVKVGRDPLAPDPRAGQPADLRDRGHASRVDLVLAHAPLHHLSGAHRILRGLPVDRPAQLQAPGVGLILIPRGSRPPPARRAAGTRPRARATGRWPPWPPDHSHPRFVGTEGLGHDSSFSSTRSRWRSSASRLFCHARRYGSSQASRATRGLNSSA